MSDEPWWQKATTSGRVTLVFVAYIVFSVLFFVLGPFQDVAAAGGIADDDFGASANEILDSIAALGAAGQAAYQQFLLGDLVYPLLQGAWMAGFIILGMRRWHALPRWTPLLPVAATLFDWVENLAFLRILQTPSVGVAWVAVAAMHLKLVFVVLSILLVVAVLGWWITHPLTRRPRQPRRLRQPQSARTRARDAPGSGDPGRGPHAQRKIRER